MSISCISDFFRAAKKILILTLGLLFHLLPQNVAGKNCFGQSLKGQLAVKVIFNKISLTVNGDV
jgi:hypothetical protein